MAIQTTPVPTTARVTVTGDISRVAIEAAGISLGDVTVSSEDDVVQLQFTLPRGHLPMTVRRELVDAVFVLPELEPHHRVHAAIPLGDVELLDGLRAHLTDVRTRGAGATCLIDAKVR